jgi:cell division protease FtsH
VLGEHERRTVAVHEMGHALVAMALPGTDPVHKISIIPRGIGALGYTMQRPSEDRYLASRSELRNRLAVLLGGRAAETLVIGEASTGAADDLVKASDIARDMVARYGMSAEVGQVVYERQQPRFLDLPDGMAGMAMERGLSDDTARRIDAAVRALVDEAFERATAILVERRVLLDDAAARLLAQETLTEADLRPIAEAARRVAPPG